MIASVITINVSWSQTNTSGNLQTIKDEISSTLDKFHKSFGNRDTATLRTIIKSPGIYSGQEPTEITKGKKFVLNYLMTSYFGDTATIYSINEREILVAEDEKSAVALEQYIYIPRSKNIPTRCITHLVKTKDLWMIDFFSLNYVISGYDIDKINEAMEQ